MLWVPLYSTLCFCVSFLFHRNRVTKCLSLIPQIQLSGILNFIVSLLKGRALVIVYLLEEGTTLMADGQALVEMRKRLLATERHLSTVLELPEHIEVGLH